MTGPGVRVSSGVQMNPSGVGLGFAVLAPSGDLVYREESDASQLMYREASGRLSPALPDTLAFERPRFSLDGRRLVVTVRDSTTGLRALCVLDRANGFFSRLGGQLAQAERDRPEWTPDGRYVLFRSISQSDRNAVLRAAAGSGADTVVSPPGLVMYEVVMAPDGTTLLGRVQKGSGQFLEWWTRGAMATHPLTDLDEAPQLTGPRFSPDGRWVAYNQDERGEQHVYVTPFPGPGPQTRIDRAGGGNPVWARDGKSVYYLSASGLFPTTLDYSGGVKASSTRQLSDVQNLDANITHAPFDVGHARRLPASSCGFRLMAITHFGRSRSSVSYSHGIRPRPTFLRTFIRSDAVPAERIPMRQVFEALRLVFDQGRSQREAGRALGLSQPDQRVPPPLSGVGAAVAIGTGRR